MNLTSKTMLTRLGAGESIATICAEAGIARAQFVAWWREECRRRVPSPAGSLQLEGLRGTARIERDERGLPHLFADDEHDLFFAFGYATAQDRLFQLDFARRKACGRLAEILGRVGIDSDVLHRTLGLARIAENEWRALPTDVQALLTTYTAGINALIEQSQACLPIEFDLLDYRPESWKPTDSLAIVGEFRWYLTGRFYVLAIPELLKRALGEGPLYQALLQGEVDDESILFPGEYTATPCGAEPAGVTISDRDDGHGSNNWVLAGSRTATGRPLVASDPHIPYAAVSIWHEVHLQGAGLHVAGVALAGMPGVMIGRNERLAWGITNNICSQRDLYLEKTDPAHPGCFLYDGRWEPAGERVETIQVRGAESVQRIIRSSRNGPIVNDVLPPLVRDMGFVSLRWLGFEPCGWLTATLGMNRARTAAEFREATRPWRVPTFNVVYADADGHFGLQTTGRIPIRQVAERGYRPGWDPLHQWQGVVPFEGMPYLLDPPRGFVSTANNRLAPNDFPYPLSGTWTSGHRARRVRQQLEERSDWSRPDCEALQFDVRSGRAVDGVPHLVQALEAESDSLTVQAVALLRDWDCRAEVDSVAATLFNVFFVSWCRHLMEVHLPEGVAEFVAPNAGGLAARLLAGDEVGWFAGSNREEAIRVVFRATLADLTARLGPDLRTWTWGRLHTLQQKHFLSERGDLGLLLDRSGQPLRGDGTTVCNNSYDAEYRAVLGPGYRLVADLNGPHGGLWSVEVASISGHPGSSHYDDQLGPWTGGRYFHLAMDGSHEVRGRLVLDPKG